MTFDGEDFLPQHETVAFIVGLFGMILVGQRIVGFQEAILGFDQLLLVWRVIA